jgi:hypothetical protein
MKTAKDRPKDRFAERKLKNRGAALDALGAALNALPDTVRAEVERLGQGVQNPTLARLASAVDRLRDAAQLAGDNMTDEYLHDAAIDAMGDVTEALLALARSGTAGAQGTREGA